MMDWTPPEGWQLDGPVEQVTFGNQQSYATSLALCPALMPLAVRTGQVDGDGDQIYLPPIGWFVAAVQHAAGEESPDTVWINPEGEGTFLMKCMGTGSGVADAVNKPRAGASSAWILWAGLAFAGLLVLGKGK